jgi:hypothetical protein
MHKIAHACTHLLDYLILFFEEDGDVRVFVHVAFEHVALLVEGVHFALSARKPLLKLLHHHLLIPIAVRSLQ